MVAVREIRGHPALNAVPYRPIACADHERLEFAALTKQWLALRVDGTTQRLLPLDVYTREGAEWLQARSEAGETLTLRLDRLAF
jgi:Rho-binding antiterminator